MSSLVLPSSQIDNVKMVVFDKDGTLIDIHHYWRSMIEYRADFFISSVKVLEKEKLYNELVENMGIDLKTKKMKPEGPVGIKPRSFIVNVALETMRKYDTNYTKEMVEEIFLKVDEYSKNKLTSIVRALPDVERLLNDLTKANVKITIATTDLSTRATLAMESLNLKKYFFHIAGADLVNNAKPSSDLVEYILEKSNFLKEEIVVIGDSMADLGMAKNARCRFLGVKSGLYTDEFINQSESLIEDFTQLKVVV